MSEPKFTPGPWVVDIDDGEIEICTDVQPDGDYISIAIINGDDNFKRAKANADLIADAWQLPELRKENAKLKVINKEMRKALESLERVAGIAMMKDDPARVTARISLRKARGKEVSE